MVLALIISVILVFIILILFSFPQFSPIPYFPTNGKDLPLILKNFNLKNNQTVFDLGAGDGVVIFEAAKKAYVQKLNTQFVAVDINPVLVVIMLIRKFFHPNKENIRIVWADLFKLNFKTFRRSDHTTVYLYVSPWLIEKIVSHVQTQLKPRRFDMVTYYYPIPSLKKKEKMIQGKNKIYVYT